MIDDATALERLLVCPTTRQLEIRIARGETTAGETADVTAPMPPGIGVNCDWEPTAFATRTSPPSYDPSNTPDGKSEY